MYSQNPMKKIFVATCTTLTVLSFACQQKNTAERKADSTQKTEVLVDDAAIIAVQSTPDNKKGSIKARAKGRIAGADIMVSYYSPAVRGRIIWGGLVPFGQVWVTGAHAATSIEFTKDIVIEGKEITAGKYAFFTIPDKDKWVVVFNKNWRQHLADQYDEKQDVMRVSVKPEAAEKLQERLRYVITAGENSEGVLSLYWEKLAIAIRLRVK